MDFVQEILRDSAIPVASGCQSIGLRYQQPASMNALDEYRSQSVSHSVFGMDFGWLLRRSGSFFGSWSRPRYFGMALATYLFRCQLTQQQNRHIGCSRRLLPRIETQQKVFP